MNNRFLALSVVAMTLCGSAAQAQMVPRVAPMNASGMAVGAAAPVAARTAVSLTPAAVTSWAASAAAATGAAPSAAATAATLSAAAPSAALPTAAAAPANAAIAPGVTLPEGNIVEASAVAGLHSVAVGAASYDGARRQAAVAMDDAVPASPSLAARAGNAVLTLFGRERRSPDAIDASIRRLNLGSLGRGVYTVSHHSVQRNSVYQGLTYRDHFAEATFGSLESLADALKAAPLPGTLSPLPNVLKGIDARGREITYRARYSVDPVSLPYGGEVVASLHVLNDLGAGVVRIAPRDDWRTDGEIGFVLHDYRVRVLYDSPEALAAAQARGLPTRLHGLARNHNGGWSPETYAVEYGVVGR
jgi:hypothetical protein